MKKLFIADCYGTYAKDLNSVSVDGKIKLLDPAKNKGAYGQYIDRNDEVHTVFNPDLLVGVISLAITTPYGNNC